MNAHFQPPKLLRNRHLQTIFSSAGPRKLLLQQRAKRLLQNAKSVTLTCHNGIRLQGFYTSNADSKQRGLVTMIHGWEGCSESLYNLSAGSYLLAQGFAIFRLNLRDHGGTQHLNQQPFNSSRLTEVVNALEQIQQRFPHEYHYLCGFSLGGNFALRAAVAVPDTTIKFCKVVAVCPVIDPVATLNTLEQGLWLYHNYFIKRWKKSLAIKLSYFPELGFGDTLLQQKSLRTMMNYFAPLCTNYQCPTAYLNSYAITGERLDGIAAPCHIISSMDDPVVASSDLQGLAKSNLLSIETSQYGGHCGFIVDYRFNSWLDARLAGLFTPD